METIYFTQNEIIQEIISNLKKDIPDKVFSDVTDDEGNQYVDLVQEGGGVLGIALLGYTYILEQTGIRFFSLAGTSAGAINTMLLASADEISKPKTEEIIGYLGDQNLFDFVDGPFRTKRLFNAIKKNSNSEFKTFWTSQIIFWGLTIIPHLIKYKGLNYGEKFRTWIQKILEENNVTSTEDLITLRRIPEGIKIRKGVDRTTEGLLPNLKIIAAEISTETRVIFPEMNYLFWKNPRDANPADYVRASMSIPLFFHPYKVKTGNRDRNDWIECVRFRGDPPECSVFVDGGILSNFPIDVFHNYGIIPRLPTFGVKLGDDRNKTNETGSIPKFLMAIFNSSRHVLDFQFLLKNPDYERLITRIDTGEHNWLNFSMPDEDKLDLFIRGARAADEFLRKFNWQGYKKIRVDLIKK